MKKIKLMADYECYPLWLNAGDEFGDINPDTLPISDHLKAELYLWSDEYNKTLNYNDPSLSGFENVQKEKEFKERGGCLQVKLQEELGEYYEVRYQP